MTVPVGSEPAFSSAAVVVVSTRSPYRPEPDQHDEEDAGAERAGRTHWRVQDTENNEQLRYESERFVPAPAIPEPCPAGPASDRVLDYAEHQSESHDTNNPHDRSVDGHRWSATR